MKASQSCRSDAVAGTHPDLLRKADFCARILVEARRISEGGQFGRMLNQLVVRADDLLGDMDEILVALDPTRNGPHFATAAKLHRELEHVQAAITAHRRDIASASKFDTRR